MSVHDRLELVFTIRRNAQAIAGIAMAPLPALMVIGALAAAIVFAVALDFVKVPVFRQLGIA
jgi:H+-transporting ATPase